MEATLKTDKTKCFSKLKKTLAILKLKETVSFISNDPPCKADNARFITVSLKTLSDQNLLQNFRNFQLYKIDKINN